MRYKGETVNEELCCGCGRCRLCVLGANVTLSIQDALRVASMPLSLPCYVPISFLPMLTAHKCLSYHLAPQLGRSGARNEYNDDRSASKLLLLIPWTALQIQLPAVSLGLYNCCFLPGETVRGVLLENVGVPGTHKSSRLECVQFGNYSWKNLSKVAF